MICFAGCVYAVFRVYCVYRLCSAFPGHQNILPVYARKPGISGKVCRKQNGECFITLFIILMHNDIDIKF